MKGANLPSNTPGQVQAVSVHEGKMVFARHGDPDQPPLLLMHGWLESKAVWRRLLPHLSKQHDCIAPDFLGHGDSDKPPDGNYSIPAQAWRILALADALNLPRFALAGHSMGGMMALYIAARLAPERITRVVNFSGVIHDPAPLIGTALTYLADMDAIGPPSGNLLQAVASMKHGRRIIASMIYGSLDDLPPDFEVDVQDALREGINITGFRTLAAMEKMDLRPFLPDIRCPVLTVHGSNDPAVPLQQARTADDLIPNHRLLVVPKGGHYPTLVNWRFILPDLLGFLSGEPR